MFNTSSQIFVPFGVVKVLNPRQAVLNLSQGRQFYFPPNPAKKECRQCQHSFPGRKCYPSAQAGTVSLPPAWKKWVSLIPAATVIPAPLAYIKVVAVNSW